jgi:hypothetical protein
MYEYLKNGNKGEQLAEKMEKKLHDSECQNVEISNKAKH